MTELSHQPCPFVSCGSSDAFSYNTDGFGKCHACDKSYPSNSRNEAFEWAKEKYPLVERGDYMNTVIEYTPKRIETPSSGKYEGMRGITSKTMEEYQVLTYSDRQEYIYPSGGN